MTSKSKKLLLSVLKAVESSIATQEKINNNTEKIIKIVKKKISDNAKKREIILDLLEKLEQARTLKVVAEIPNKMHEVDYSNPVKLPDLVMWMEKGVPVNNVPARPFLKNFKDSAVINYPNIEGMSETNFDTIKKNIEDDLDSQFAKALTTRKLDLAPLAYRKGTPLVRSGQMYKSIRWRVVEAG